MSNPEDYKQHALGSLPFWFSREERVFEVVSAFAEMFCDAEEQAAFWKNMSYILLAESSPVDWIAQHGKDRNISRSELFTDDGYRTEIRFPEDAVTFPAVDAALSAALAAAGYTDPIFVYSLRGERAFFGDNAANSGTGGTITQVGADAHFELTGLVNPPVIGEGVVIAGASNASNDGTYIVTGYSDNALVISSTSVVDETFPGTWSIVREDSAGNPISGFAKAYFCSGLADNQCGYRMGENRPTLMVLMPSGCNQDILDLVQQVLDQTAGAGVLNIVECKE